MPKRCRCNWAGGMHLGARIVGTTSAKTSAKLSEAEAEAELQRLMVEGAAETKAEKEKKAKKVRRPEPEASTLTWKGRGMGRAQEEEEDLEFARAMRVAAAKPSADPKWKPGDYHVLSAYMNLVPQLAANAAERERDFRVPMPSLKVLVQNELWRKRRSFAMRVMRELSKLPKRNVQQLGPIAEALIETAPENWDRSRSRRVKTVCRAKSGRFKRCK